MSTDGSSIRVPNEIYHPPPAPRALGRRLHVFYIPGNPGMIAYYTAFLAELYTLLNNGRDNLDVSIYGRNLGGFDIADGQAAGETLGPLGLQEQIDFVRSSLETHAARLQKTRTKQDRESGPLKVILMGHSVGAFILLEILRSLRSESKLSSTAGAHSFHVVGAVLLFPTIVDIADSPHGQKLSRVLSLPSLPSVAQTALRCVTGLLPAAWFRALIHLATKFPESALDVTVAFLKSRNGVKQALYMANEEMKMITTDRWDEDIWNAGNLGDRAAKLFLLFGQSDHWVANHTRDQLMQIRGSNDEAGDESGRPWMGITEVHIPHSFCIRHNAIVAESCARFISRMV